VETVATPPLPSLSLEFIARLLNKFPEVQWDELIDTGDHIHVFGWMEWVAGEREFLLLRFVLDEDAYGVPRGNVETPTFITSSDRMCDLFYERLGGDLGARWRVGDYFGQAVTWTTGQSADSVGPT
jgi:hypothetical protein